MSSNQMASKAFGISSFTTVGHLLHINLKDHLIQHKSEIGQALLERNKRAIAVVNKLNTIDNTYRNFDIEVIARREGCTKTDEELMIVEVKENKCRFLLDFSKVYWNSRLSTEHERIIEKFNKPNDIVFDLFAGIGPFSVPAAKAKCTTYANDLNPESVKWLESNMRRNKVLPDVYEVTNLDAKDYILNHLQHKLIKEYRYIYEEQLATKPRVHIIMNLPALAPSFLPHFVGLLKTEDTEQEIIDSKKLPELFRELSIDHIVYCYCFLKGAYDNPKEEVRGIIEENFGRELSDEQLVNIFKVRNVAPYKDMYRVEIKLDESILFNSRAPVGIMRSPRRRLSSNGYKRVTINDESRKRPRDDMDLSDEKIDDKRAKFSYCSIS